MNDTTSVGIRLAVTVGIVIDYTYMIGVLLSFVFLLIFIKGLSKKNSLLSSPFYFFMMVATASDILCNVLFYMLLYILEPLFGGSADVRTQKMYHDYIYVAILFVARIFFIMDITLDAVLTINRFTAFVLPFTHKKVRLL